MLTGRNAKDLDFLVLDASPEEFQQRFPAAQQVGKAFPVFILDGNEYAFPRSTACSCCSNAPGATAQAELMADLDTRDFTINALALPLPDYPRIPSPATAISMVISHPRTLDDLHKGILRPASASALTDDPLRAFRAARFAAQMPNLTMHPDLIRAMREIADAGRLAELSPERVGSELRKALKAPAPGRFLRILAEGDCLEPWFAEFSPAPDIPAGPLPWHDEDVLEHTAQAMDRLAADEGFPPPPADRELACWMTMCHDLGKTITPKDKHPSHHGHDILGEDLAHSLGERLALPTRFVRAGTMSARLHMKAGRYPELRAGTRVDLLDKAHSERLTGEIFAVVKADKRRDHSQEALRDMAAMKDVRLLENDWNLGPASGEKLRMLRSQAVAHAMREGEK